MRETYIGLTADDFQCLVRGGQLTVIDYKNGVKTNIILKDIGFDLMHELIERVEEGKEKTYEGLTKEIR